MPVRPATAAVHKVVAPYSTATLPDQPQMTQALHNSAPIVIRGNVVGHGFDLRQRVTHRDTVIHKVDHGPIIRAIPKRKGGTCRPAPL